MLIKQNRVAQQGYQTGVAQSGHPFIWLYKDFDLHKGENFINRFVIEIFWTLYNQMKEKFDQILQNERGEI